MLQTCLVPFYPFLIQTTDKDEKNIHFPHGGPVRHDSLSSEGARTRRSCGTTERDASRQGRGHVSSESARVCPREIASRRGRPHRQHQGARCQCDVGDAHLSHRHRERQEFALLHQRLQGDCARIWHPRRLQTPRSHLPRERHRLDSRLGGEPHGVGPSLDEGTPRLVHPRHGSRHDHPSASVRLARRGRFELRQRRFAPRDDRCDEILDCRRGH